MNHSKALIFKVIFSSVCIVLMLAGCARYRDIAPGTVKQISSSSDSAVVSEETVTIPFPDDGTPPAEYVIGPGDVLFVNVSGKPEFSSLNSTSSYSQLGNVQAPSGSRVDGNVNIEMPYLGTIHVGGMSLTRAQKQIQYAAKKFLNDPWVVVEVGQYKSHPLYLLGQFRSAGTFYMDRPMNLLQGIALGNGHDANADLTCARLIRDKKTMPVDINDLLTKGDQRNNIWLRPGDTIFIPDNKKPLSLFSARSKKEGPVPIPPAARPCAGHCHLRNCAITDTTFSTIRIIRSHSAIQGDFCGG
jgi:polysaccharide export outer membrane protein